MEADSAEASGDGILLLTSRCDATSAASEIPPRSSDDVPQGLAQGVYAFSAAAAELDLFSTGTVADEKRLVATYRLVE